MKTAILKFTTPRDTTTHYLKIENSKKEKVLIKIAEKTYEKLNQLSINEPVTENKLGIDK